MQERRKQLYNIFFNSLILYLLSYLVIFIPSQFLTSIVARAFSIPTIFKEYKIGFTILDHDNLWTQDSIIGVYITSPLLAFLTGFFFLRYLSIKFSIAKSNMYLFSIWLYMHCFNMFFGGLAIGIPLIKGFGFVPIWLFAPFSVSFGLIIISFIVLFANGLLLKKYFMTMADSEYYLNKPLGSLQFKTAIAFLPCLIGNLFFYLLRFPDSSLYERLLLLTQFCQLVTIYSYRYYHFMTPEKKIKVLFSKKAFAALAGLVMLFLIWRHFHNYIFG
jgi:hypothetical protein